MGGSPGQSTTYANCTLDCSTGPEVCDDGVDNDCNDAVDCADGTCTNDEACQTPPCNLVGESCIVNADCCNNKCRGPGGNKTCR